MPQYISLEANVHFDELVFCDNSLHINTINKPVAECTDIVQNFLDNFGFLDDLALFDKKKYAFGSYPAILQKGRINTKIQSYYSTFIIFFS